MFIVFHCAAMISLKVVLLQRRLCAKFHTSRFTFVEMASKNHKFGSLKHQSHGIP